MQSNLSIKCTYAREAERLQLTYVNKNRTYHMSHMFSVLRRPVVLREMVRGITYIQSDVCTVHIHMLRTGWSSPLLGAHQVAITT